MNPETDSQPLPVLAPCVPDAAVDRGYDATAHGTCANGHPLNKAGRCAEVNDHRGECYDCGLHR